MPDYIIGPIAELHTLAGGPKLRRGARMRDTGVTHNAAIAVIGDTIAEVGDADEILRKYDLPRSPAGLVTPGLVDAHTHICWAGNRADEFLRRSRGESYEEQAACRFHRLPGARVFVGERNHRRALVHLFCNRIHRRC